MLISRETWPKVLRWSSLLFGNLGRIRRYSTAATRKFALTTLIFLLLVPGTLISQESPKRMVLLKGPYEEQGLPFLPRDISPYFSGEYLYRNTKLTVLYLQRSLSNEAEWQNGPCAFEVGVRNNSQPGTIYYLPFREGESILAMVPEGADLDICAVLNSFQQRFSYFLNTSRQWLLPPFSGGSGCQQFSISMILSTLRVWRSPAKSVSMKVSSIFSTGS